MVCVAALTVAVASVAVAADIPAPVYKAPAAVAAFSWTGCYVGLNAGGGFARKEWTDTGQDAGAHTASGAIAGGQVGCNYQTGAWVFGAEGMFDWSGMKGDHINGLTGLTSLTTEVRWLGTATARVGYAIDRSLFYVKGGAAWVRDEHEGVVIIPILKGDATRVGWTVGAGFEYAFAGNWSAKIEYNYLDFGSKDVMFCDTLGAGICGPIDIKQNAHLALVGVNYRFTGRQ